MMHTPCSLASSSQVDNRATDAVTLVSVMTRLRPSKVIVCAKLPDKAVSFLARKCLTHPVRIERKAEPDV
jgi:hypothetical protein